jgi:hypothetical protein
MDWRYVNSYKGTKSPEDENIVTALSGVSWANLLPAGGFPTEEDRDTYHANRLKIIITQKIREAQKEEEGRKWDEKHLTPENIAKAQKLAATTKTEIINGKEVITYSSKEK